MTPTKLPRLLTTAEVAEWLGYCPRHVARMARQGRLPGQVIGGSYRFREDRLLAWLAQQPSPAVPQNDEPVRVGGLPPLMEVEL